MRQLLGVRTPEFGEYFQGFFVSDMKMLAEALISKGCVFASGGADNHLDWWELVRLSDEIARGFVVGSLAAGIRVRLGVWLF